MSNNNIRISKNTRVPLPGHVSPVRWKKIAEKSTVSDLDIKTFLIKNPKLVETYLLENVNTETLEKWKIKKQERPPSSVNKSNLQLQKQYFKDIKSLSTELSESFENYAIYSRIEEGAKIISRFVDADSYTLYIPKKNEAELSIYKDGKLYNYGPIGIGYTVAALAAFQRKTIFVRDISIDKRFPKGTGHGRNETGEVLCIPVILPSDDFMAVIEITKNELKHPFNSAELELANCLFGWMASTAQEHGLRRILSTQQRLNEFLLETTKGMFDEMTSIDRVVQNIMTYTKDLVNADRCSLFLYDDENDELFANIFDEGEKDHGGTSLYAKKSQLRFEKTKGIAGQVFTSGQFLNIYDAYKDKRFNKDVDKTTGYTTRNILCMPIAGKSKTLGVVEMINSLKSDHFSHMDERALKMFAVYCALALHYCRLYNLLASQQAQYKVSMEVIQYHIVCTEDEMRPLLQRPLLPTDEVPPDLTSFYFTGYQFENVLPQLFIQLIVNMFGENKFSMKKLCRFALTVKKNYRRVSYHNWTHGFHVAHCVWCMLYQLPDMFSDLEKMALVIAGLCHDVDHRGYNNAFFEKLKLPLANLYSTSVMEQHHYRQAVLILHTEGQDIFSFLNAQQYKEVLETIREAILGTDLALYFENRKILSKLVEDKSLDFSDNDIRRRVLSLMMTGSDLSGICKPWSIQKKIVSDIYDEFYMQGDEEKKRGLNPISMMDRTTKDEIPKQQIGFIDFVCLPLYQTLYSIFPTTKPLLEGCKSTKQHWEEDINKNAKQV